LAGGVGAVTRRARVCVGCLLLPLLDPVRLAEDLILADLLSEGRMEVVVGLRYVPHEFDMFGIDLAERGRLGVKVFLFCFDR
jgi:alkanesulfonate monooxygenase SsuD/methylene tetrahydromethanopterin reductase-like flavin-dependent oxidoreductase (luciferase family)